MVACKADNVGMAHLLIDYGANPMPRDYVSQLSLPPFHVLFVCWIEWFHFP